MTSFKKIFTIAVLAILVAFGLLPSAMAQGWDWAKFANSTTTDNGNGIAVDKKTGEVYVVGSSSGSLSEYGLTNLGSNDGFLAKYKADGTLIWAFAIAGVADDQAMAVVADSFTQRVFVTGYASGTITIAGRGGAPFTGTAAGSTDIFVAAFDSAGNVQWATLEGGPNNDVGNNIVLDQGAVYVCGNVQGSAQFDGATGGPPVNFALNGILDWFVAKYAKSDGTLQWARTCRNGAGFQRANGIAVDSAGVYFCGAFDSPSIRAAGTVGNVNLTRSGSSGTDIFMYSLRRTDGLAFWGYKAGGPNVDDEALTIATSTTAIYLGGRVAGNPVFSPLAAATTGGIFNGFISSHSPSNGDANWLNVIGNTSGPNIETVSDIEIDELQCPWAGGFFTGNLRLPNILAPTTTFTASGTTDLFMANFDITGGLKTAYQAGGTGGDGCSDLGLLDSKNVYVTGAYSNAPGFFATTPSTTLPQEGVEDIHVAKYSFCNQHPTVSLTVTASQTTVCNGDSLTLTIAGSQVGATYTIINNTSGLPIGAPRVGNGGNLVLSSGPLNSAITLAIRVYIGQPTCAVLLNSTFLITVNPRPNTNLGPDRLVCPGTNVTLDAGAGFATYLWSTGALTRTIVTNVAGTYRVTVTNASGCPDTDTILVNNFPAPSVNIGPDINQCGGFGPILSAGPGFASYLWSTFQPSSSIVATSSGTYSVVVTDGNGCQAKDTMVLNLFALPTPNLGPDRDICAGSSTVLNPGAGFSNYAWSTGATTPTLTVNAGGSYTVTVTDANGCTASDAILIGVNALPTPNLGPDVGFCAGTNQVLSTSGSYSAYNWSNGDVTATTTVTTGGTYSLSVTDAKGCIGTDQITVTVKPLPIVNLGPDRTLCTGNTLVLDAGSGFLTYAWSTGNSSQLLTVSSGGNYNVTVTDAVGCSAADTMQLTMLPLPSPNLGPDLAICAGNSAVLNPGGGFTNYAWSNAAITPTITVSAAGTYAVTVTDANGCTASDAINITVNALPTPNLGPDLTICAGNSAVLNPGGGFTNYAWSNAAITPTITVSAAGPYAVTVTDANGCTASDAINITVNALPGPNLGPDLAICAGNSAVLNPGGGFTNYAWSNAAITPTITVSAAGTYAVTVTDANGCTASDAINISVNPLPTPNLGPDLAICAGNSAVLNPGGGFTNYAWSNAAITPTITVSAAGTYAVTVTDANGCTASDAINISANALPTPNLGPDLAICAGNSAVMNPGGGFNNYAWSNAATTPTITVSAAGTYAVTVTDANGCTASDAINITVNALPSPNLGPDLAICAGNSAVLNPGGGFANYAWSNAAITPTITVSAAGTSAVTVTDANGCTASDAINITVNALPSPNLGPDISFCTGSTATLDPGSGFNTYAWSSGFATPTITVASAGTFTVTVSDANGCTNSDQITVTVNPLPTPNLGPDIDLCFGSSLVLNPGGGYVNYAWSNGAFTPTISVSTGGSFDVTVTDGNGCIGSDQITITVTALPTVSLGPDTNICGGGSLVLDAGIGHSIYAWTGGASTPTITVSTAGTYMVKVTDLGGCQAADTIVVGVFALPTAGTFNDTTICPGTSLVLNATGGLAGYLWSNGPVTASITVANPGNYAVTVTDAAGCTASRSMLLSHFAQPLVSAGLDSSSCAGDSIDILATAGFVSYAWSNGQSTPAAHLTLPGSYSVTVTDVNRCPAQDTMVYGWWALPTVLLGADTAICMGGSVVLDAGPGFNAYLWNGGAATQTLVATTNGLYATTVTDVHGCQASDTLLLRVDLQPIVSLGNDTLICPNTNLVVDAGNAGATFQWSTGATAQSITLSLPGTYIVTVTNVAGCFAIDSLTVGQWNAPALGIPAQTFACSGDTVLLDAAIVANSYLWSTGSTAAILPVISAGIYTVDIIDTNGCAARDTAIVSFFNSPMVNLGADTSICPSSLPYTLDAGNAGAVFSWTSGQSTATINAFTSGLYGVQVTDTNGCTAHDSLLLNVLPIPTLDLGADTTICGGGSTTLTAVGNFQTILWSTNETTASIIATNAGLYWATGITAGGCAASDSVLVSFSQLLQPQLGNDTTICEGNALTLSPQLSGQYLWSNGDTTANLLATATGMYAVTVTQAGCVGVDSLYLTVAALPLVDIGPDRTICPGNNVALTSNLFGQYAWSTGATSAVIFVAAPGWYALALTDNNGCVATDSMWLRWATQPTVTISNLQPAYCETDGAVLLQPSPSGGVFSGAADAAGTFDPGLSGIGVAAIGYDFVDSLGCNWHADDSTMVVAAPSPAAAGPDQVATTTVQLAADAPSSGTGHWELGSLQGNLSNPNDPAALLTTTDIGEFAIVWVVENAPCSPTRDTLILHLGDIAMPTGFSPNGDHVNDTYVIRGIASHPDAKFQVYNRWGNLVWQSAHYHDEWDGNNMQGQPLADDTYFATLEYEGHALNTFIVLARSAAE